MPVPPADDSRRPPTPLKKFCYPESVPRPGVAPAADLPRGGCSHWSAIRHFGRHLERARRDRDSSCHSTNTTSKRSNIVAISGSKATPIVGRHRRKNLSWAASHHARVRSPSPSSHANGSSTELRGPTRTSVVRKTARACPAPSVAIHNDPGRGSAVLSQLVLNKGTSRRPFRSVKHELDQLVGQLDAVTKRFDALGHKGRRGHRAGRTEPVPELGHLLGVDWRERGAHGAMLGPRRPEVCLPPPPPFPPA